MATDRRLAKIRAVVERRWPDFTLVLENIHDPHNVSAILRTCDAVGVERVALLYHIEKFPKIGRKSSASASKWVARDRFTSVEECYAALRAEGFAILTTFIEGESRSLYDCDLTKRVAIVIGNEHRGVSEEAVRLADGNLKIPQTGMLQSLNVSVSAAVILYEAFRQRTLHDGAKASRLTEAEIEERYTAAVRKAGK